MDIVFSKDWGLPGVPVSFALPGELAAGRGNALQACGGYLPAAIRIEWTQVCPL
jgi:hypothetical protein